MLNVIWARVDFKPELTCSPCRQTAGVEQDSRGVPGGSNPFVKRIFWSQAPEPYGHSFLWACRRIARCGLLQLLPNLFHHLNHHDFILMLNALIYWLMKLKGWADLDLKWKQIFCKFEDLTGQFWLDSSKCTASNVFYCLKTVHSYLPVFFWLLTSNSHSCPGSCSSQDICSLLSSVKPWRCYFMKTK